MCILYNKYHIYDNYPYIGCWLAAGDYISSINKQYCMYIIHYTGIQSRNMFGYHTELSLNIKQISIYQNSLKWYNYKCTQSTESLVGRIMNYLNYRYTEWFTYS